MKLATLKPSMRLLDTRSIKPRPKQADAELQTTEHRQWAEAVKRRAGYRCEAVDKGQRCPVGAPARIFADHIIERRDGGAPLDVENGQCLCGKHHSIKTARARAKRLAGRPEASRG